MKWLLLAAMFAAAGGVEPVAYPRDGDTIVMASGEVVRLENVDTPELRCECTAECRLALRALTLTREAVAGGVMLARRVTGDGRPSPDRSGRTIALVRLPDGRDLGELLIRSGLGRPYHGERRRGWCG